MNISRLFIIFLVSFLVGVLGYSIFIEIGVVVFCGFLIMVLMLLGRLVFNNLRNGILILLLSVVLGLLWGFLRSYFYFIPQEKNIADFLGVVEIEGCIVREPDVRENHIKYTVEVNKIVRVSGDLKDLLEEVKDLEGSYGKVLINYDRYPRFEYGDCLKIVGENTLPGEFDGFSYEKYLRRFGVFSLIKPFDLEFIEKDGGEVLNMIFNTKGVFEERVNAIFGEPVASLMAGVLTGSRRGIPKDLMEDFNSTGLTHIIAISGYNITLLILIVSKVFSRTSQRMRIILSVLLVIVFVIFVGAGAAVIRAGIMGVFGLLVLWFGKSYIIQLSLIITAFVMTLINPMILYYDVSFQLSFLATWGVVCFNERVERYFQFLPKMFLIRESVSVTIAAQLLVLPIIIWNFERLSIISPVANLLVLPLIPWMMIGGFVATIISFFSYYLGVFVGLFGVIVSNYVVFVIEFLAGFSWSSKEVGLVWWVGLIYFYLLLENIIFEKPNNNFEAVT